MLPKSIKKILEKNQYRIVGKHSAVQICRYTKRSLRERDSCWKEQFYGIKSHRCCQFSPSVMHCHNQCIHCWRPIELNLGTKLNSKEIDEPKEILDGITNERKKLLMGFKGKKGIDMKKFKEALEPNLYTFSLSGEATLYPRLAELIKEVRKRKAISFLVTNGLEPEKIKELQEKNSLPTQLTLSLNSPNKKLYDEWHRSLKKDAWKEFNKTLKIISKLKCRTALRLTLIKEINMQDKYIKEYAKLIKKASPRFIHVKAYSSLGYSQQRVNYKLMPMHKEIVEFSRKLLKYIPKYKFLDEKKESRVVLLGKNKNKKDIKIKKSEI